MENNNDSHQQEEDLRPTLNPLISVWLHPKQTARYMIDRKSIGFAILILSISNIGVLLSNVMETDLPVWLITLLCVVLAPISGLIGVSFSACATWLFGKLFKGIATFSELFKALSITAIPYIVLIPLYLIWLYVAPESLLMTDYPGPTPWIFWPATLATIIISIWSFVIAVAAVAEAHQISNWRAFFTVFIPSILFGIFVFILVILFMIITVIGIGMI
ncbi:YIP1 family protein [Lysinibacillus sp. NPDC096418]|uniref:YIP1 family protein n=1 Tax=Lysinibacillus sp. NPDC096418 TaxID=3364138 RepID=UPI0038036B4F